MSWKARRDSVVASKPKVSDSKKQAPLKSCERLGILMAARVVTTHKN